MEVNDWINQARRPPACPCSRQAAGASAIGTITDSGEFGVTRIGSGCRRPIIDTLDCVVRPEFGFCHNWPRRVSCKDRAGIKLT